MKRELVQLAKDKGFIATFVHDKPFIHSSKEPLRWLFWMTELQKWLRDVHDTHIRIQIWQPDEFNRFDSEVISVLVDVDEESTTEFLTYEEALEKGLFESLNLIKDE